MKRVKDLLGYGRREWEWVVVECQGNNKATSWHTRNVDYQKRKGKLRYVQLSS
jgi:hypothetical protein